jgi:hypothetical protein
MSCPSENELVEWADGLLSGERASGVTSHVDTCDTCRAIVADLARHTTITRAEPVSVSRQVQKEPEDVLRTYLAKDARERELSISRVVLVVIALGIVAQTAFGHTRAVITLAVFFAYEAALSVAMGRGWFHRFVPMVSTCVEVSFSPMFALWSGALHPIDIITSPLLVFRGGHIVFVAVRTNAWLCVVAGTLAAIYELVVYAVIAGRLPHAEELALGPRGAALRAALFGVCGIAGAILARHFVRRAVEAVREIREQDMLGRYVLRAPVGRGGMGEVWSATYCPEGGFVRNVAVKKLPAAAQPALAEALRREAQIASRLTHPNIVQVLDCGRYRGDFVLVMELIDGMSLSALLKKKDETMPPAAVAYVGAQIAGAIAYLQERELVHCDVNPPNVMISRLAEVKLADFGVMRARADGDGTFGGKVSYAAPEQISGRALDSRTDLYALGVTLAEALPDAPPALREIIDELIRADPSLRPNSAQVVHDRLLALAGSSGKEWLARAVQCAIG